MTCCSLLTGAVGLLGAVPVRAGTGGTLFISWPPGFGAARGSPIRWSPIPRSSVTLTAPSFGAVHVRRVKGRKTLPCRPRDRAKACPHGVRVGCSVRHAESDPAIGTPLCPSCFDAEGQVIWNAMAPALWHRTWTYFSRELAGAMGMSHRNGCSRGPDADLGRFSPQTRLAHHRVGNMLWAPSPLTVNPITVATGAPQMVLPRGLFAPCDPWRGGRHRPLLARARARLRSKKDMCLDALGIWGGDDVGSGIWK
jgi:hypothetical protein